VAGHGDGFELSGSFCLEESRVESRGKAIGSRINRELSAASIGSEERKTREAEENETETLDATLVIKNTAQERKKRVIRISLGEFGGF
jgi:hypothetical protein